jgi:Zn-dependent membrane protease YugP
LIGFLYVLSLVMLGITFWAQWKVAGTFKKWSGEPAYAGLTGAQVARQILDRNGLHHVPVELVPGELTDHYDPIHRVVRLSEPVYYGQSIAAISVAAHECGHAIQHKEAYGALVLRHRMFPIVNFASGAAPILLGVGLFLHIMNLFALGILFYTAAVAFQLVTLPVEFNASSRAKKILIREGLIRNLEERGVNKVLNAAAFTYVAATLYAVIELVRFIFIFLASSENDD